MQVNKVIKKLLLILILLLSINSIYMNYCEYSEKKEILKKMENLKIGMHKKEVTNIINTHIKNVSFQKNKNGKYYEIWLMPYFSFDDYWPSIYFDEEGYVVSYVINKYKKYQKQIK